MDTKKLMRVLSTVLTLALVCGMLLSACAKNGGAPAAAAPASESAAASAEAEAPVEAPAEAPAEEEAPVEKQVLKIGIATCFSGNAARGAETQLYGLQVALDQIKESGYSKYYDFELIQGDDQYDATEAVAVANKLVYQDGIKAVFGHLNAVVTLAALPIYEEAKVPCFTPSGSSAKIINSGYEYVYMCVPSDSIVAATLVNYLVNDAGYKKIGMFYANNDQGQSGLEYVETAMAALGIELAAKETYVVGDTDFTGQMLNFKAAETDCIVIWGGEISQRSIMVQQARQLIGAEVGISGDANFSNATFISTTQPEDRNGVLFPVAWSPTFKDDVSTAYVEQFKALDPLAQDPGAVTVRFYDGMYLLATALNELGVYDVNAEDFTEKLNEKIKQVSYEGLQGLLDPAPNGECLNKAFMVRYTLEGEELIG